MFFGYSEIDISEDSPGTIVLKNCRNCLYWSKDMKGFLGLAVHGPSNECRIGPSVKKITIFNVTSICEVSKESAKKWEVAPWG